MKRLIISIAAVAAGIALPVYAQQSLGDAARKAREQKKELPPAKRVFTNDDLPAAGVAPVSTVGSVTASGSSDTAAAGGAAGAGTGDAAATKPEDKSAGAGKEEAEWRKKFSDLRAKIATAEKELDIMQRELNLQRQQYYSDPNVALREQYAYPAGRGGDINDATKKIADKKRELDALKRQLAELEDDLRRAGGPSSWSRQ